MSWQKEIDDLRRREALAKRMGGEEKVARHHNQGKLTVRERITALVDPGSFREVGTATGVGVYNDAGELKDFIPANFVLGRALIDGRRVVIAGDDFTVRGGANDAGIFEKALSSERMARDLRLPIVRLVDGTGGGGSVKNIETKGHTLLPGYDGRKWVYMLENLATVPVVSLALGSTAGLGAARVAASHYSVIVKETAQMFVAGPPVVARIGQKLEKNELGGSQIHTRIGAIDDEAESEADAFERTRRFLSYLPPNVYELPPRGPRDDDPNRREELLLSVIPRERRRVYKMRPIIETLMDKGSFFEIGKMWGRSMITGFARLDGWPVAVMANDCYHYARRLDSGGIREGRALRRPRRGLPPADGAPRRQSGLPDRPRRGEDGHDPLRRQGAGRGFPVDHSLGHDHRAQGVRRRRLRPHEPGPLRHPRRLAVG